MVLCMVIRKKMGKLRARPDKRDGAVVKGGECGCCDELKLEVVL